MTIYIGIDVAKRFHVAALVDDSGRLITHLCFDNNATGYQQFFACLDRHSAGTEPVIGMESTGHYGAALRDRLVEHGYTVQVLNPLKSNRSATSTSSRSRTTPGMLSSSPTCSALANDSPTCRPHLSCGASSISSATEPP